MILSPAELVQEYAAHIDSIAASVHRKFRLQPSDLDELKQQAYSAAIERANRYASLESKTASYWQYARKGIRHAVTAYVTTGGNSWTIRNSQRRRTAGGSIEPKANDTEPEANIEADIFESEHAAVIAFELLSRLSDKQRRVLDLRYLQGCSLQMTAELLGISKANVAVIAHRAKKELSILCNEIENPFVL